MFFFLSRQNRANNASLLQSLLIRRSILLLRCDPQLNWKFPESVPMHIHFVRSWFLFGEKCLSDLRIIRSLFFGLAVVSLHACFLLVDCFSIRDSDVRM